MGELDASTDEPLYVETGALWMHRGDDAYVRSSLPILKELGFPVEPAHRSTTPRGAIRRSTSAACNRCGSSGAPARCPRAARACVGARRVRESRRDVSHRARRARSDRDDRCRAATRDGSRIEADAYVFACGPWLGTLFPDVIGDAIRPTRQEVFYFGTPRGSERYAAGTLPDLDRLRRADLLRHPRHRTAADSRSPTTRAASRSIRPSGDRTPSAEGIARARHLLAERFPELAKAPLLESRVCQYENSPDGHLIIDRHPHAKNVWLAGGGSGHGFKLSPAVGEMAAQRCSPGKKIPKMFRLERLRDTNKP